LSYTYNTNIDNRLNKLRDNSGNNTGFKSSVTPYSYQYDKIGNLVEDEEKDISSIKWTVYGKVASVTKNDTEISYKYDATGNRIYKKVVSSSVSKETHYVRDASGNLMATYENKIAKEFVIYGSNRLGIYNGSTSENKRILGNKKYELSNHLGNVLSVISDNKIGIDNVGNDLIADIYEPYVVSESDYYPFGMQMASRSFQNEEYSFGFNGMDKDKDLGDETYTTEFRIGNSEIVRWFSTDPKKNMFPAFSPYSMNGGNPILFVDQEGDVIKLHAGDAEIKVFKAILNKTFAGKIEVEVKDGIVTLIGSPDALGKNDRILYDKLTEMIENEKTTDVHLADKENRDKAIIGNWRAYNVGNYKLVQAIDLYDILMLEGSNISPEAAVMHELWEAYQDQVIIGMEIEGRDRYLKAHKDALKVQGEIDGVKILGNFKGKDGKSSNVLFSKKGKLYTLVLEVDKNDVKSKKETKGWKVPNLEKEGEYDMIYTDQEFEDYRKREESKTKN